MGPKILETSSETKNVFVGKEVILPNESRAYTAKVEDAPKIILVKNTPAPVHLDAQTIPDWTLIVILGDAMPLMSEVSRFDEAISGTIMTLINPSESET